MKSSGVVLVFLFLLVSDAFGDQIRSSRYKPKKRREYDEGQGNYVYNSDGYQDYQGSSHNQYEPNLSYQYQQPAGYNDYDVKTYQSQDLSAEYFGNIDDFDKRFNFNPQVAHYGPDDLQFGLKIPGNVETSYNGLAVPQAPPPARPKIPPPPPARTPATKAPIRTTRPTQRPTTRPPQTTTPLANPFPLPARFQKNIFGLSSGSSGSSGSSSGSGNSGGSSNSGGSGSGSILSLIPRLLQVSLPSSNSNTNTNQQAQSSQQQQQPQTEAPPTVPVQQKAPLQVQLLSYPQQQLFQPEQQQFSNQDFQQFQNFQQPQQPPQQPQQPPQQQNDQNNLFNLGFRFNAGPQDSAQAPAPPTQQDQSQNDLFNFGIRFDAAPRGSAQPQQQQDPNVFNFRFNPDQQSQGSRPFQSDQFNFNDFPN